MKNDSEKCRIFIAYSLKKYTNSEEAVRQESFSLANDLYQLLDDKGYSCFLMSPDNPSVDFTETPSIAKNCDLFLLVTDKTIIEKKESGMSLDNMWWYNELKGFMSKKEIGGKPQLAKNYIQSYIPDLSISDSDIQGIHDVFQGKNPIRNVEKLYSWINNIFLKKSKDTNSILQNNEVVELHNIWDVEVAEFWDNVYAPARPSKSEIRFYRDFFIEIRRNCSVQAKVLILGSTKPLIKLAIDENFIITVVDSSKEYSDAVLKEFSAYRNQITLINCDWSEMDKEKQLQNMQFDIIIGDMSIGNIPYNNFKKTIQSISQLLKEGGYWLGKNLFHFSKNHDSNVAEDNVKDFLTKNPTLSKSKVFAGTVYDIAIASCVSSYKQGKEAIECYKMDFNTLYSTAIHICRNIAKTGIDCSTMLEIYKDFSLLHKKRIDYYIYDIKGFIAEAQKNSISIKDIGYGSELYSKNFPLLILEKNSINPVKKISELELENTIHDLYTFFSEKRNSDFVIEWAKHLPSQYYIVRLSESKYVNLTNDPQWQQTLERIRDDITKAVKVYLKPDLFCYIKDLNDDKMDTEIEYIKNIVALNQDEIQQMKETYQLAVLLYLSAVLTEKNDKKEKPSLYHLSIKKLFEDPLYDTVLKCWRPRKAPWVTAKVCTATSDAFIPTKDSKLFIDPITRLIDDYDYSKHNWNCTVGSHMDTCSLCIEAILWYYQKLDTKGKKLANYQNQTISIFLDILSTYVLENNIFETITFHPIGKNSIERMLRESSKTDEPYQKKVLGSVTFFTSLLKIINFIKMEKPEITIEEKYKYIILNNLITFWSYFKNIKDDDFDKIGKKDICTVPQILYSLSQALESVKS